MAKQIISQPAVEPVTLAQARAWCRVDSDYTGDDTLIATLITGARQDVETITRRALVTQQWKMVLDCFPAPNANISSASWYGPQWGVGPGPISMAKPDDATGFEIFVPLPPLVSVDSIQYVDTNGVTQTLDPTQYIVDLVSEPARITPAYGVTWPATRQQVNAVTVTFTCGYGAAAAVPAGIMRWMQIRIATIYANREEVAILQKGKMEVLPYVDGLLDPWRVVRF
jgi:hypothetical protein